MEEKLLFSWIFLSLLPGAFFKYMEGELHTLNNWAFLARFCFLSEEGQFEYYIEYNDDQGEPNLLLYYDTEDQWPAVYKSNKTCEEKENVLHTDQNQIVNLTAKYPFYKELSGCIVSPNIPSTARPRYTVNLPTLKPILKETTTKNPYTTLSYNQIQTTLYGEELTTLNNDKEETTTTGITKGMKSTKETTTNEEFTTLTNKEYTNSGDLEDNFGVFNDTKDTNYTIIKRSLSEKTTKQPEVAYRRVICRNARRFRSSRERWWFLAISNCKGNKGINIRYKILMTNGPQGDYWHEHFSADEFYILPILMAFSIAYCFLILAIIICTIELKSRQLLHSTYKLFLFSALIQFFGILMQSMAYLRYAVDGVGAPKVKTTGSIFMGTSETTFLLLLLLLAKGYTVTRGRLSTSASVKLTIFMCLYIITYITLFIYEAKVFDPGEVLYLYESPAGYGLIILRVSAWCMFIYSTVFTLKHFPEKSSFYYPFNICGTLWFIAGPAFILSANTYIDKWVRESVVAAILLFITFSGHLMFLVLTMPSVANKNFPYHVRTTQIGVMEVANLNGTEFAHNVYEPSSNLGETVIIPLTRRTEEMFDGLYGQRADALTFNREINDNGDNTMQNVLSWSIAKNFTPVNLGIFNPIDRNCLGSARSRESQTSISNHLEEECSLSRKPSIEVTKNEGDDYVKEVPVELFTISKMIISPNNK